ncbi:MAG: response regulator transcription factor [Bacteroidota bacterium]
MDRHSNRRIPRLIILEDDALIAIDLAETLEELGFEVAETVHNGPAALHALQSGPFDLAILDINLGGGMTGIEVAQRIQQEYPMPFIFLTALSDRTTLEAAKQTGPAAYLVKPFRPADLLTSIELAIHNFQRQQPAKLSLELLNEHAPTPLTSREKDMLQLLLDGNSNREIAEQLFLSIATVKSHFSNLYSKLGVRSRVAALAWLRTCLR